MSPETALLLARYRLLARRRPDVLSREPWYLIEGQRIRELGRTVGIDPPERAIQAAAVLSPAVQWETLVRRLPAFLHAFRAAALAGQQDRARPPRFPGYGPNVRKAWRILAGIGRPTGPKVSRFALNLAGDETPVTVDRWAARAAGLPDHGGRAWYQLIERAYLDAARIVGMAPSRLQAVLWVAVRERIVHWGPVRDGGIAFRTFQPDLPSQDALGSTIAPNSTRNPMAGSLAPGASY